MFYLCKEKHDFFFICCFQTTTSTARTTVMNLNLIFSLSNAEEGEKNQQRKLIKFSQAVNAVK